MAADNLVLKDITHQDSRLATRSSSPSVAKHGRAYLQAIVENTSELGACLLGARGWRVCPVAGDAVLRSGLIEQNLLSPHLFEKLVTFAALYVLMGPAQGESRSLIVIEQGRLPFHAVMAVGTRCGLALGELLPMDVLVAVLAQHRCRLEIDIDELGFKVRRLMTVDAGGRAVRPQ